MHTSASCPFSVCGRDAHTRGTSWRSRTRPLLLLRAELLGEPVGQLWPVADGVVGVEDVVTVGTGDVLTNCREVAVLFAKRSGDASAVGRMHVDAHQTAFHDLCFGSVVRSRVCGLASAAGVGLSGLRLPLVDCRAMSSYPTSTTERG